MKYQAIIPQAFSAQAMMIIVKNICKQEDLSIQVHNYTDYALDNNPISDPDSRNGIVYMNDLNNYQERRINLISAFSSLIPTDLDSVYPGPKTILSMTKDDLSILLMNAIIEKTGGYVIPNDENISIYKRIPPTTFMSYEDRTNEAKFYLQTQINDLMEKTQSLFDPDKVELLSHEIQDIMMHNIQLKKDKIQTLEI